jgi:predicted aconitase
MANRIANHQKKVGDNVKLTYDEKAMLEGREGLAKQKAMELLIQYGEALGAEKLVDTDNVCGSMGVAKNPFSQEFIAELGGEDALFSELNLNTPEVVQMPRVKAFSCQLEQFMDPNHWQTMGMSRDHYEAHVAREELEAQMGVQLLCTCTPYLVGNVPVFGEHCAWMESSAVVYINSVLGARSNVEGRESTCAAMLTGKIPYWGYHLPENRLGTHLIEVAWNVDSEMDWGILGYYAGQIVKEKIPVINGIRKVPNLDKLKPKFPRKLYLHIFRIMQC